MAATSHWSHVEKVGAIALELAQLGYPITFITGRVFEDYGKNLHPNIKFQAQVGLDDKMTDEDAKKWMSLEGEEQEIFVMQKFWGDTTPDTQESVQIAFRDFRGEYGRQKPLIFIYDQSYPGHYPVLLGAPGISPDANIAISLAPLTIPSNDSFPFRNGNQPHTGPDAKAVHFKALQDQLASHFNTQVNNYWWSKLKEMGATREPLPDMFIAMNTLGDHLLQLGIPEFEFARSDVSAPIRYFGAFRNVGKSQDGKNALPEWWDDIAKAKAEGKKIVAVSQGTVGLDMNDLLLPTIEALKDRDDLLLIASTVVYEPKEVPNLVIPANTRVEKFVPYSELLPLLDVLVSNGGYGAVQQCLQLGIPMVVGGIVQDKATTNALIQYTGVGIDLRKQQPGVEAIRKGVAEVLGNTKYKEKAMIMSKAFERYDISKVLDGMVKDVVIGWMKNKTAVKGEL
ncbi:UDP-Glycosyltransferase/glycogen phosphorylase [Polyplosphaeria fusca]|uniref:UDP-Glycosyltransferase/glycogen phosphorylase n=1 Tax=Polyplosphaeria fusca TaxID=682080 RepID=A0A9P4QQK5_9PLEO|nr:UDP-Glycosyltransferase/glycogen phosphorylase [Polyplosphaeria fusca]